METKKAAVKKTTAKKTTSTRAKTDEVCYAGDERPAVAKRNTPNGVRLYCETHAARVRAGGTELEEL